MRKISLFIAALCISNMAIAKEVTFFNRNPQSTIELTYELCKNKSFTSETCDKPVTLTINRKFIFDVPGSEEKEVLYRVNVLSAVEKDDAGNTIAQGHYAYSCVGNTFSSDISPQQNQNGVIVFDDLDKSPVLACFTSAY